MRVFFFIMSFLIGASFSASAKDVYVYRSEANTESLDLENARRIFDTRKLAWEDGKNIVILLEELDQTDEPLFTSFVRISKTQFLSRWRIKFFSGRALIPIQVKSVPFAMETLKSNPASVFFSFRELADSQLAPHREWLRIDKFSY